MHPLFLIVFEGLVGWTEKMTATQLNSTDCNWTIGCSCPLLRLVGLLVALLQNIWKTVIKLVAIGCNQFFKVCIISYKCTNIYIDSKNKELMSWLNITIYTIIMCGGTSLGGESICLVGTYIPHGCTQTMWSRFCSKNKSGTTSWWLQFNFPQLQHQHQPCHACKNDHTTECTQCRQPKWWN